jgi:hypothetical protein
LALSEKNSALCVEIEKPKKKNLHDVM